MPRRNRTKKLRAANKQKPKAAISAEAEAWAKATLRKMSLAEKVGQLVAIPFFAGEFVSEQSREFGELARQVEDNHVGALIAHTRVGPLGIERSRAYPTAALASLLQARARIPLVIASDFERGTAMRLEDGTSFPHAMSLAAGGRLEDAYEMGRVTALEARSVGVHWVFAPVADVNSDPANPIINIRSFGEDPKRVGEWVAAYIRGVEENGALATAKHFPGHGETSVDSHLALPTISSDRAHIENVELVPFRAAIKAGVSTIMTGHLAVPALEPDGDLPVTFSEKITHELLRRRLGFEGIIVTDDLSMGGIAGRFPTGETAVRSIQAGADVLLVFAGADAAIAALREAAESGRLPIERIDDAVARILRAKARVGVHRAKAPNLDALAKTLARPEFASSALDIAGRGVTLLRDAQKLLPLDATQPRRVLLVALAADPDRRPGADFERELPWRVDALQVARADTRFEPVERLELPPADSYDLLIVALFVRITNAKNSIGLPGEQATLVRRLLGAGKPAIVACFGSPYLLADFPEAKTWLAAFSTAEVAQRAAARAIFGQTAVAGHIPVNVPGAAPLGAGIEVAADPMKLQPGGAKMDAQLVPVYKWLDRAVAQGDFPGGTLAVGHKNRLAVHAFGKFSRDAKAPHVKPDTIFDTASLTKAVVTTTLAAMLSEARQFDLDSPVARYLPEWGLARNAHRRGEVTIRHLLTHTSGLPDYRKYFETLKSRRAVIAAAMAEPLIREPGAESVYSDVGFIALGEIIERLTGRSIDRLASERIFAPLGMVETTFRPGRAQLTRISPVTDERRTTKLIRGVVHDENAAAMGGVAGHTGMFSTAADVAAFCQMMLNGGVYAHTRLLRRQTVAEFTAASPLSHNTRTPGWMAVTQPSSSGKYFSSCSFGHLGWTGTSMWIDPEKQLFVVLLTNRVNPSRDKIRDLRAAVHDAVVEALRLDAAANATGS